MRRTIIMLLVLSLAGTVCPVGVCAQGEVRAAVPELTELTREDVVDRLNSVLDRNSDIRAFTPGLEEKKTTENVAYYEYKAKKLDDLDQTSLLELFRTVNQQLVLKDLHRLNKQDKMLKDLKRISQLPKTMKRNR